MSFAIVISDPIADLIRSWTLPIEIEDQLLDHLANGLTREELTELSKVPAPSPTFILDLESPDSIIVAGTHYFTFWLTFGPLPDHLYVHNCEYRYHEDWSVEEERDSGDEG